MTQPSQKHVSYYGRDRIARYVVDPPVNRRHFKQEVILVLLFGIAIGAGMVGRMYGADYQAGIEQGRALERGVKLSRESQLAHDLQTKGLCWYADNACGFYHNPSPRRGKRP